MISILLAQLEAAIFFQLRQSDIQIRPSDIRYAQFHNTLYRGHVKLTSPMHHSSSRVGLCSCGVYNSVIDVSRYWL